MKKSKFFNDMIFLKLLFNIPDNGKEYLKTGIDNYYKGIRKL